jgi:hypothetical protein
MYMYPRILGGAVPLTGENQLGECSYRLVQRVCGLVNPMHISVLISRWGGGGGGGEFFNASKPETYQSLYCFSTGAGMYYCTLG